MTVFGSCFEPGERVSLRVHVSEVGSATGQAIREDGFSTVCHGLTYRLRCCIPFSGLVNALGT